jgi:hypothetical protein
MSFLTSQIDLTNTIFTEDDLQKARAFLSECIRREKPAWVNNPQGPFGGYWKRDDIYTACIRFFTERLLSKLASQGLYHTTKHPKIEPDSQIDSQTREFSHNMIAILRLHGQERTPELRTHQSYRTARVL